MCDLCGNKTHFIEDMSSGDTICLGRDGEMSCGKVVQDHKVFEGVEKRNFEDDDKDRHQHGPGTHTILLRNVLRICHPANHFMHWICF